MAYEHEDIKPEIDIQGGRQIQKSELPDFSKLYRPSPSETSDRYVEQTTETSAVKFGGADNSPKAIVFTRSALAREGVSGIAGMTETGNRFAFSLKLVVSLIRRITDGQVMITYRNKGDLTQMILPESRMIKSRA